MRDPKYYYVFSLRLYCNDCIALFGKFNKLSIQS